MSTPVMVVAGEASGDAHMAPCIRYFQAQHSTCHWFGIGGDAMREAGVELLHHYKETNVMGFVEVLTHYRKIRAVFKQCVAALVQRKPAVLVLVDYPGFNLRLAKKAKQLGVPVLYFIAPKIWASRPKRLADIQASVSHMAVIFPFEVPFYQQAGVSVSYVGNPLKQTPVARLTQAEAKQAIGLEADAAPVIGLLPGSRSSEVTHILPEQLRAAQMLQTQYPQAQFVLVQASHVSIEKAHAQAANLALTVVPAAQLSQAMQACDVAVVASGTATLEVALLGTPQVVVYKMPALSHAIAKRLVTISLFSLLNVVAEKEVVKELIQADCTATQICTEVCRLLEDSTARKAMREAYLEVDQTLGEVNTATALAGCIAERVACT